jgi:hypothetical protein
MGGGGEIEKKGMKTHAEQKGKRERSLEPIGGRGGGADQEMMTTQTTTNGGETTNPLKLPTQSPKIQTALSQFAC